MTQPDIAQLVEDGIVDEVIGRLKSGKEADIWICRHAGELLAAKMYRDRDFRSFKNNALYKEGRGVQSSRTRRAIERGSKFGREADEQAWKAAEADALFKLHAHEVRVPKPVLFYEGVLLMQLVTDASGSPASRLIDVSLTAEQARAIYKDLRTQIIRMLCADLIHGDLSPYNVLLAAEGPTIIDFPQIIAAAHNSNSERFFKRDLENIRTHLAGADPSLSASVHDADEIWHAYFRRELTPDFEPTGRPPRTFHRPPQAGAPRPQGQHPRAPQQGQARPQHGQPRPPQQGQPRPLQQGQPRPPQHGQARPPQHGQPRPPQQGQPRPPQQGQPRPPQQGQPRPAHQGQRSPQPSGRPQRPQPQIERRPLRPPHAGQPQPAPPPQRPAPLAPQSPAQPGAARPPGPHGGRHRFHRGRRPT